MAFKLDKKTLIHGAAGLAVAALALFAVSQCNGKGAAEAERDDAAANAKRVANKAAVIIKDAQAKVDSLALVNRGLDETVAHQADSIVVLNDSIVVLNDSISVLNGKLADCHKCKKAAKQVKPAKVVKPVVPVKTQPAPVKVRPADVRVVVPDTVRGATVVVTDGAAPVNVNNVNVHGDNNGQVIINNGGIVYGNSTDAASAQKKAQQMRDTTIILSISRVRTVVR